LNHKAVPARRRATSGLLAAALLAVAIASPELSAQDGDPGAFEVRTGSHELVDGVYYVNGLISLRLPSEAANALHSRLPLTIRVEVEFLNRLRFWWDTTEHKVNRRSQLAYYPLTERYVVHNINTGDRDSFVTLTEALEFIGRVDDLPVVDAALLDEDRRYDVRIRAVLDTDELPGPLALLAFWRRDWSIESDWLQWRLDDD
jgi:hypothetical protein